MDAKLPNRSPSPRKTPSQDSDGAKRILKVVVVGPMSVGKSSILLRLKDDAFSPNISSTIGVDFIIKTVVTRTGNIITFQIWDTAGQERFRSVSKTYYRGSHIILYVFDLTNEASFKAMSKDFEDSGWISKDGKYGSVHSPHIQAYLIGNKSDLTNERAVATDKASAFAEMHGMRYMETSAKTGNNITLLFQVAADNMETYDLNLKGRTGETIFPATEQIPIQQQFVEISTPTTLSAPPVKEIKSSGGCC